MNTEIINGQLVRTQTIRYSNGTVVKRIFEANSPVPTDIIVLVKGPHTTGFVNL